MQTSELRRNWSASCEKRTGRFRWRRHHSDGSHSSNTSSLHPTSVDGESDILALTLFVNL
jgi:hypothetical protein